MPPLWTIPVVWLLLVNLIAFLAIWRDKRRAEKGQWRIRERTLFTFGALGGIWGMMFGMRQFRHKTKKASFLFITGLLFILNLGYYFGTYKLWESLSTGS